MRLRGRHRLSWRSSGGRLALFGDAVLLDGRDGHRGRRRRRRGARGRSGSDLAFLNTSRAMDYLARVGLGFDLESISRRNGQQVVEVFSGKARDALAAEDIEALSQFPARSQMNPLLLVDTSVISWYLRRDAKTRHRALVDWLEDQFERDGLHISAVTIFHRASLSRRRGAVESRPGD